MTESEWLVCSEPVLMLEFLRGKASNRKLRLFAIASFICRGFDVANDSTDVSVQEARQAVMVAEFYADGSLSEQAIDEARSRLFFQVLLQPEALSAARQSCRSTINLSCRKGTNAVVTISETLSALLRDIFGNPFRPVAIDPKWKKPPILALTESIYNDRAFDHVAGLADTIEEAGCQDAEILDHLRGSGKHVRGCWVVDLLIGKE